MAQTPPVAPTLRVDAAMRSHVGLIRSVNEDFVCFVTSPEGDTAAPRGNLALVADGMGGHAHGEVASALAGEVVRRVYYELEGAVPDVLAAAFAAAHRAILEWSEQNPECAGMGTTCTALALHDDKAWLAHIGDSRAYLWRKATLTQLSADQTLVAQMLRNGVLTAEEAENSPVKNVILQALGAAIDIVPEIWSQPLRLVDGDVLILCTDGLWGLVGDVVIAGIAARLAPHDACDALIEAALAAGGHDNVSVGVLHVVPNSKGAVSKQTTRRLPSFDSVRGADDKRSMARILMAAPGGFHHHG
jgi:PPM family protein phosphatase